MQTTQGQRIDLYCWFLHMGKVQLCYDKIYQVVNSFSHQDVALHSISPCNYWRLLSKRQNCEIWSVKQRSNSKYCGEMTLLHWFTVREKPRIEQLNFTECKFQIWQIEKINNLRKNGIGLIKQTYENVPKGVCCYHILRLAT